MQQISELTTQQKTLLTEYKIKWQLSALSTEPINKQKATKAIEAVYNKISQVKEFDIYFFDSQIPIPIDSSKQLLICSLGKLISHY